MFNVYDKSLHKYLYDICATAPVCGTCEIHHYYLKVIYVFM